MADTSMAFFLPILSAIIPKTKPPIAPPIHESVIASVTMETETWKNNDIGIKTNVIEYIAYAEIKKKDRRKR